MGRVNQKLLEDKGWSLSDIKDGSGDGSGYGDGSGDGDGLG